MSESPPVVEELGDRLRELGRPPELWVGGSLATGDYTPGISDLDLVALVAGPVDDRRRTALVDRALSGVARAELVRHGYAVFGRPPLDVLPAMSDEEVRAAARAEVCGYWAWAASHPRLWLNPVIADLGLTSMARGRHTLATGELLTKSAAIDQANAPEWLVEQLKARRRGEDVTSPRVRTAVIAWRDARRTVAAARR